MAIYNWSRSTLRRREREGLRFIDGRIYRADLIAWLSARYTRRHPKK